MGKIKLLTIKEFRTMNGREVPIYKVMEFTKEDIQIANEEAAKKMEEELGKPSSPTEIVKILKGHAEDTTGETVEPKVVVETKQEEIKEKTS